MRLTIYNAENYYYIDLKNDSSSHKIHISLFRLQQREMFGSTGQNWRKTHTHTLEQTNDIDMNSLYLRNNIASQNSISLLEIARKKRTAKWLIAERYLLLNYLKHVRND